LLTEICRLIVEVGGYRMAWVGFAEHDPAKTVRPVAQLGFEDGYLEHAQIAWDETERGRGPTGAAIRTGAVQVNQDFLTNPAMAPWRESALARGYQSSIALPLKDATATFGALTIYSSWPDAFDTDETGLLTELANDLAYGINALRIRAERQRADEVLHSTTATLQALFDHSPLAIMMLDLDGHIRLWNKAAERMYGWAADEVQGHFLPTVSNETSEEYKAIRDHAARGEPITSMEVERKRKDGSNIWIGLSVAPLRDTTGKIYAQMSIAVDITDRKRADQELYARNRELSILYTISSQATQSLNFEQALDAALTTTLAALDAAAGGIYLWEPGVPTLKLRAHHGLGEWRFGVDRIHPGHSLLGRAIDAHELLVIDLDDYPIDQVPPHVKNSGLHSMVTVPLMSGGVMLGVLIVSTRRSHAFLPADLNMLAAIGRQLGSAIQNAVLYEQTQQELIQRQRAEAELQEINAELETRVAARTGELAAANERLQELDRLKSKFVSDVSHELRTPMTALSLNVDVLEHGQPEKQEQTVQAIRQQAQRVMQLIEDILNLSRLELGADKVQFATVALNPLIAQVVALHQPVANARNLTLTFTPYADLPAVRGEENQLAQVITNLIGNAINYTQAGEIYISTGSKDAQVLIEVRDTGLGIAPDDLPHLFERFYRGHHTRQIRGTGLGLAIVKEIVDLHDGRIEVESEVGVGTTLRVWLPIAK
jgi:PAS domain S-box-containing protein